MLSILAILPPISQNGLTELLRLVHRGGKPLETISESGEWWLLTKWQMFLRLVLELRVVKTKQRFPKQMGFNWE